MEENNTEDTEGNLFSSASSDYRAQKFLGCGSFGEVLQCRNLTSNETVALKFIRQERHIEEAKHEEALLKKIQSLNSNKFNIVRWIDSFIYEGLYCLEFEKLDISLHQFVQGSPFQSLAPKEIRPILQQLATALQFLASIGIVHADLKPDNIMMVDHLRQPLRIKVIDFGLAFPVSKARQGPTLQARWYRSPEILLGAPFNEAIDIWSLGCIAAGLFMGIVLFPGKDDYDMMRHMVYTVGKPPDHLLSAGLYSLKYFNAMYLGQAPIQWRFKSSLEARHFIFTPRTINSLNDLLEYKVLYELSGEDAEADQCDRVSFVDLLTGLLKVDMSERITPSQVLQHPFITMSHLEGFNDSLHVRSCLDLMSICQSVSMDDSEDVAQSKTCTKNGTYNSTVRLAQHSVPNECHSAGCSSEKQPQSPNISWESNQAKKRKRDSADKSPDCGNRTPDTSPAKKSWTVCLDPIPAEIKSPQPKRKRDDTDRCTSFDNSSTKRIYVNVYKELTDSFKNCELPNSENGPASTSQVSPLTKSNRDDEEESGSCETFPHKRRENLSGGGEGANQT